MTRLKKNPYRYSYEDIVLLAHTDVLELRDLALRYQDDAVEARRIIHSLVEAIYSGREIVSNPLHWAKEFLEHKNVIRN